MKSEIAPVGTITACQICAHRGLETILSLGHQALVSSYLTSQNLRESEVVFPLNFCRCSHCGLLQLDYVVNPKTVFHPNYQYQTGMTSALIRSFRDLAELLINNYALTSADLVVDIGSNDGTLLKGFQEKSVRVLGVEPTNTAQIANRNGIPTIQAFFTEQVAKTIVAKQGRAKVVTMTNAFAHVNGLFDLLKGVRCLLHTDGIFVTESQYLLDTIEKLEFDCIYHEHLRFYSLKPLIKLFSLAGMSLIDVERVSTAGGSIRAYAMTGKHAPSARVIELLAVEEKAGLYDQKTFKKFAADATIAKHALLALVLQCKTEGKTVVGISSPARSNTLLGFSKIDNTMVDYLCEREGSPKVGLFSPGMHLPVVDESRLLQEQPDYALVLSWHIGAELMQKLRKLGYKGKFIMPLPTPCVVAAP